MIKNEEYIRLFITRSLEEDVDNLMLSDKNFVVPKNKIHEYIKRALSIPYQDYIEYIRKNHGYITDDQLTQSSSFAACTSEMCKAIEWQGNPGMKYVDIGQLFPQYIKQRNEAAFRKYGENQVKTSAQLGLTFEYYDFWYLTCVGYVYNELDERQQKKLLARTILRTPLYQDILLRLLEENVDMSDYMINLAPSTQGRRSGSIIRLLKCCLDECIVEGIKFHDVYYPIYVAKTKSTKKEALQGTATRLYMFQNEDSSLKAAEALRSKQEKSF